MKYLLGSEVVGVVSEGDEEGAPWRRTAVGESTGEEGASEDGGAQGGRRRRHGGAAADGGGCRTGVGMGF